MKHLNQFLAAITITGALTLAPRAASALTTLPLYQFTGSTCEAGTDNQVVGVCGSSPTSLVSGGLFSGTYDETATPDTYNNANIVFTFNDSAYLLPESVPEDPFGSSALVATPTAYKIRFDTWVTTSTPSGLTPGFLYFYTQRYQNPNLPPNDPANQGLTDTGEYSFLEIRYFGDITTGTNLDFVSGSFCYAGTNPSTSANQCGNSNAGTASVILRGTGDNIEEVPTPLSLFAVLPLAGVQLLRKRYLSNI